MLTYIETSKIKPHPDNPRKDLGDLNELSNSIKANGIMQNLTVVPWHVANPGEGITAESYEGTYIAVIGHRRLAAAKMAGLTEVPCMISDMSPREQVATMLLENMQRSDLTVYEQAQGFQQLLDFGETVSDIAERTGFSETTVRKRVKLLELDQDKFEKSVIRGGTLQDYAELEKIKDIKIRNSVLEEIGTSNFSWKLNQAIDDQEKPERKSALIAELDTFAKRTKSGNGLQYVNGFYGFKMGETWKKPADAEKTEYLYTVDQNSITLYKKEEKKAPKLTAKEKAYREREGQLKQVTAQAYESRYAFITDFNVTKKHIKSIQEAMTKSLLRYSRAEPLKVLKLLNIEKPADIGDYLDPKDAWALISNEYQKRPERVMLIVTYCRLDDGKTNKYYQARDWEKKIVYEINSGLDAIYDFLVSLGYELSDEEQALKDGTHELLAQSEEVEQKGA